MNRLTPEVRTAGGNRANAEHKQLHNAAIVTDLDADRKAFSTLAARLALKGCSVFELSCGGYFVSRFDGSLHCSDLAGVRAFYERLGGSV